MSQTITEITNLCTSAEVTDGVIQYKTVRSDKYRELCSLDELRETPVSELDVSFDAETEDTLRCIRNELQDAWNESVEMYRVEEVRGIDGVLRGYGVKVLGQHYGAVDVDKVTDQLGRELYVKHFDGDGLYTVRELESWEVLEYDSQREYKVSLPIYGVLSGAIYGVIGGFYLLGGVEAASLITAILSVLTAGLFMVYAVCYPVFVAGLFKKVLDNQNELETVRVM